MAFTRIRSTGITTTDNYEVGVITATKFVGGAEITSGNITGAAATFSGNVSIAGTLTYMDVTNVDSVGVGTFQSNVQVGAGISVVGVSTFTGDIDANADIELAGNIAVTGVSTFTGNIDANGALDVDGQTDLDVLNVADLASFSSSVGIADSIIHTGNTDTSIRFPADDTITAETAGTERLRITSAGSVGINSTSPGKTLDIIGSLQVKDAGNKIGLLLDPSTGDFQVNQSVASWGNPGVDPVALLRWGWTGATGNYMYMGSGGNDAVASQMALLISGEDGFKVGRSAWDGSNGDISATNEFFTVSKTGSVGIGTSVPTRNLQIDGTAHQTGLIVHTAGNHSTAIDMDSNRSSAAGGLAEVNFKWNGTTVGQIGAYAGSDTTNKDDGHIHFGTASAGTIAEALRITSAGKVLIGHSAAQSVGTDVFQSQIIGTNYALSGQGQFRFQDGAHGASIILAHSRHGTKGSHTILQDGDEIGKIRFHGSDGNDFANWGAQISAKVDGTPGSDDMPGRLEFYTTPDGSGGGSERVRITAAGDIEIGNQTDHSNTIKFADSTRDDAVTMKVDNSDDSDFDIVNNRSTGDITVATNSAERVRITKDGIVALSGNRNQVAPTAYDELTDTNNASIIIGSSGITTAGIMFRTSSTGAGRLYFGDNSGDEAARKQGHIEYHNDGDFMRFGTNGTERLRINSGGQISIRGTSTSFDTTGDLDSLQLYYETDSGQASIGPYSSGGSTHLSFYTNSGGSAAVEALRITSAGALIVGTTSPFYGSGDMQHEIRKDNSRAYTAPLMSGHSHLLLHNSDTSPNTFCGIGIRAGSGDGSLGFVYRNAANNADFVINTDGGSNGIERLRITSGGQVGIGTTIPTQESGTGLHLRGAHGGQTRLHFTNSDTGDTTGDGFYIILQGAESGSSSGEVMLQQKEDKHLKFATNNTERWRITARGSLMAVDNKDTVCGRDYTNGTLDDGESVSWNGSGTTFTNSRMNMNSVGGNGGGWIGCLSVTSSDGNPSGAYVLMGVHGQGFNTYTDGPKNFDSGITVTFNGQFNISNSSGDTVKYAINILMLGALGTTWNGR